MTTADLDKSLNRQRTNQGSSVKGVENWLVNLKQVISVELRDVHLLGVIEDDGYAAKELFGQENYLSMDLGRDYVYGY